MDAARQPHLNNGGLFSSFYLRQKFGVHAP
jgi:hypothetical protein